MQTDRARLELSIWRTIAFSLVCAMLIAMGQTPAPKDGVFKEITAQRINVVDDEGHGLVVLGEDKGSGVVLIHAEPHPGTDGMLKPTQAALMIIARMSGLPVAALSVVHAGAAEHGVMRLYYTSEDLLKLGSGPDGSGEITTGETRTPKLRFTNRIEITRSFSRGRRIPT